MDGLNYRKEGTDGLWTAVYCTGKQKCTEQDIIDLAEAKMSEGKQYVIKDGQYFFYKSGLMAMTRLMKKYRADAEKLKLEQKENELREEETRKEEEIVDGDVRIVEAVTLKTCPNKRLVICIIGKHEVIAIVKAVQRRNFKSGRTVMLEHNYDNYYRML